MDLSQKERDLIATVTRQAEASDPKWRYLTMAVTAIVVVLAGQIWLGLRTDNWTYMMTVVTSSVVFFFSGFLAGSYVSRQSGQEVSKLLLRFTATE